MAATTITGQEALFAIAEELGEKRSEYIGNVVSAVNTMRGISLGHSTSFVYGLARVIGKGIRQITAYDDALQKVTVATAFSPVAVAGDYMEVILWDAEKRANCFAAINEAIRLSWPYWYQETTVLAAASTITLAAATENYNLPTTCDGLIAVGIQPASTEPVRWIPPSNKLTGQVYYRVEGSPGALVIRFEPRFNRQGGINQYYDTQKLCTWYATREPVLTAETSTGGTTQLPSEYFSTVGAEIYRRRWIGAKPDAGDERAQPLLQEVARQTLLKLGYGKRPINALMDELTPKVEEE